MLRSRKFVALILICAAGLIVVVLLSLVWLPSRTEITVRNESSSSLTSVEINVSGNVLRLSDIAAGASVKHYVDKHSVATITQSKLIGQLSDGTTVHHQPRSGPTYVDDTVRRIVYTVTSRGKVTVEMVTDNRGILTLF